MSNKRLVLIFFLALFMGALANVPASFVLKQAGIPSPKLANVTIQGVSGTIWSGKARLIDIKTAKGTHTLSNFTWRINPLYLFVAKAKTHVTFTVFGGNAKSDMSIGLSKTLYVNDLTYSGALQPLVQTFSNGMADANATVLLSIDEVSYQLTPEQNQPNWPVGLKAQLVLNQGQLTKPIPMLVGDVQADITQTDDGQINAVLNGKKGELDISGNASITSNLNYATDIKLTPTDKLQNSTQSVLGIALPQQPDGHFVLKRKGVLQLR